MYARVTSFQVDPAKIGQMQARLGEIKPQSKSMAGIVTSYAVWRADGHGVVTAIFTDKASADAAGAKSQAIWAGLAAMLKGPPKVEVFESVEHLSG